MLAVTHLATILAIYSMVGILLQMLAVTQLATIARSKTIIFLENSSQKTS